MSIDHQNIFVGGQWIAPRSTQRSNIINASTEEIIGSVPKCNNEAQHRQKNAIFCPFRKKQAGFQV